MNKQMWYIPTVEYYSIITRKEVQIHVIAWVIFADSVLSKRIQNTKLCFCLYEMSLRGKFTDVEYRLLVTSSWGEGKNSEWPFIEYESESVNHSVVSDSDPMDCSPPGSSIHGILQARILEQGAISFSRSLPDPGIEPRSPALQADSLLSELVVFSGWWKYSWIGWWWWLHDILNVPKATGLCI